MKLQRLLSLTRQAVDTYHMIDPGDHIALGISGGKDSLTLLYALANLQRFYPNPFSLSAITVDLGFGNMDLEPIKALCSHFSVPYKVIPLKSEKSSLRPVRRLIPAPSVPGCAKVRSIRPL